MRDLNEGDAPLAQACEDAAQHRAAARVEPGGRLVEDEDLGLHGEDARERAEASLAARERKRGDVALAGEPHELERAIHAAAYLV